MYSSKSSDSTTSVDENEKSSISKLNYFHGVIQRQDAEELLKKNGDFLLRASEFNGKISMVLSSNWDRKMHHFVINSDGSSYWIEGHQEKTIDRLIQWFLSSNSPVTKTSGAKIKTPVGVANWIIEHENVNFSRKLGEGAFGEVYLAECKVGDQILEVAVKTMRTQVNRESRSAFMKEARLMRKFSHPNIVKIIGVAVHAHPIMIIMEMCPNGSLLSYLRKENTAIIPAERLRFCTESAEGLAYLEKQKCLHRDIAARNCLLSEKYQIKISDFGLSDDKFTEMHDDTLGKVPIKWLAPEVLQEKLYSLKSDVWAFGVLMWEIYADGHDPYPNMTNMTARAKIVCEDYRMSFPEICPKSVSDIALKMCWPKLPNDRATMGEILKKLIGCASYFSFLH